MIAYVDSSVLLRRVLSEPEPLAEWSSLTRVVTSALTEVECLRTLDRIRVRSSLGEDELVSFREDVYEALRAFEVVELTRAVLARASQPYPTSLGTLDSIHLATALLWSEAETPLLVATHDEELGMCARACGLEVIGARGGR